MKQKISKDNYVYCCPYCNRTLAIGNLLSLYVMCPDCTKWVNYNQQDGKMMKSGPSASFSYGKEAIKKLLGSELYKKAYGRDRLTIEEMTTNREDCRKAGHSHYFSGKPCKYGHIAPRTKRGDCNECNRIYARKLKEKDPEKVRRASRESRRRARLKAKNQQES